MPDTRLDTCKWLGRGRGQGQGIGAGGRGDDSAKSKLSFRELYVQYKKGLKPPFFHANLRKRTNEGFFDQDALDQSETRIA